MAKSLAVKYRPKTFEETLGQTSVIRILQRQLETHNISNCYLFCGPSGDGKAQPLTSKILTPNGYKFMGDIKVGDDVVDGKGNITKVLGVYPQGIRDIYKISLNDGTSFEVADNHLNTFFRNNTDKKQIEYFTTDTLSLKNMLDSKEYKNWNNERCL